MTMVAEERANSGESTLDALSAPDRSAFQKYATFFVGRPGLWALLQYELAAVFMAPMPGAAGLFLRRVYYPHLCRRVGSGVAWGRNVSLRHPGRISIGDRVGIDDGCLLDARGGGDAGIVLGDDVIIARDTILLAKKSWINIGDRCVISSQCMLGSSGGIQLGRAVMIGGHAYIGGGHYRTESRSIPMMDQETYSRGPVVIEDDVWIGANVTIIDGVHIGTGSVIGAGAVIRENVPPFTVVSPYQKLVLLPRAAGE